MSDTGINSRANVFRTLYLKIGFVKLPFQYDLTKDNKAANYLITEKSSDTLFFDAAHYQIIGILPDTTDYIGVLYFEQGDGLYPSLITFNKNGVKIDDKRLCYFECADIDCSVDSCSSNLILQRTMDFEYQLKITTSGCDSKGHKISGTSNCVIKRSTGHVLKNGRIMISEKKVKCN
jgi:hypothetical protein